MDKVRTVILAAGQGTRMRSQLPKVMHPLLGRPMVWHGVQAAAAATGAVPVVVVGVGGEQVRQALGTQAEYVEQVQQLGTAHAVLQAELCLRGQAELVLVTFADMPLLTAAILREIIDLQMAHPECAFTMLTVMQEDARGFGRILRDEQGHIQAIVEDAHATPEQKAIHEVNPSVYCFRADWLWDALKRIPVSPKREYYLTDAVALARAEGLTVQAVCSDYVAETIGVNTRVHLAEAQAVLQQRLNREWMLQGVTMIDPSSVFIEPGVTIGPDTLLWPGTYLHGSTTIGSGCEIGPNTIIRDTRVGDGCTILASVLDGAIVEDEVDMGPFARLRKGAHLGHGVHMGNFGEVKDSYLAEGVKMGHFSYIGNAQIGANTNIGAGTITCNYDGVRKNKTEIGEDVFIGSDTMLVAPVKLGDRARTGAGAVVTRDVPADTLVVGVPAKPLPKKETSD